VTQDNIAATICRPGWSRKNRPPVRITDRIKHRSMIDYGLAGQDPADYELDHLVPISWGGGLADPENLWPESPPTPNPKDRLEKVGLHAICMHRIGLADAQSSIARDWVALAARLHVKID
jgi:hypothetical protein